MSDLRRFQAIFQLALDSILLMDDAGRYIDVNPAACDLLGYSRDEILRLTINDITPPADRGAVPALLAKFVEQGRMTGEYRLLRKDGTVCEVEFHATANILPGVHLAIHRDVSKRSRADERLRTTAMQLAEAQRIAHVGSWNWDLTTGRIEWSDETYRIFGLRPQEIEITFPFFAAFVHPDDRKMVDDVVGQAINEGQPFEMQFRVIRRDQSVQSIQSSGRVSLDERGKPTRLYGIAHDVTERRRFELALQESADRLQAMSRRVVEIQESERRRIAHELHDEIGQVLSAVAVNLHAARARDDSPDDSDGLDESLRLVERATEQVRNLSLDLRPSMLDDLGLVSTLRWYADRQACRAGFLLHFHAEATDPLSTELQMVCYRVVQEALTNVVRHAQAREVWIDFVAHQEEVTLSIRDDGIGCELSAALSKQGDRPSFGVLGMKERVELVGGRFEITSAPNKGTRIVAYLPTVDDTENRGP